MSSAAGQHSRVFHGTAGQAHEVPFYVPDVGEEEIAAVVETLRSGWITIGPRTQEFEQRFAAFLGARHAVAVSSCTAALHLALDCIGIQPGDEVITSTLTFTATGATILHAGGKPVLVDVSPDTLNLDPADVARKVSSRTRAIVPVHYAGHPAPMDELLEIARKHNLLVVEDAAHALPASYKGRRIGTIGHLTAFSFYATKNLCTGEGGMLTTERDEWADVLRTRRLHGMSRDAWRRYSNEGQWRYDVLYPGFKYNMTDLNAALGVVQLRRLPQLHERRCQLVQRYYELLADVEEIQLPQVRREVEHAWHLFVVRLRTEMLRVHRDRVMEELRQAGVGTQVHFIPLHMHSFYRDRFGLEPSEFPVASDAAERIVSLPLFTRMGDADVEYVCEQLRRIVRAYRR
ncbi:UDP-4-amino-4-deoxy-L-arabinose--oxoglutarate aminotransferase [bacterium HR30]|nr:UDP-4-amino-4-deoxy-L-arabinose--oxoglutarate aminotransferase [bacterium HR30]